MNKEEFEKATANINNSFTVAKERIGAKDSIWKLLPKKIADISSKFNKGEPISDVELQTIKSEWLSEDPLIDENGNPFVFYIHDFARSYWGEPKRVFHVAWCHTLETMRSHGRKKRYIKKTDLNNNKFSVDYGNGRKGFENLPACYNCQTKMQKKVYPNDLYYDRNNLDIIKFFKMYGKQDLINMDNPHYQVDYPNDWRSISLKLREEAGWICSKCKKNYSNNKSALHVHHKDGIKSNINFNNLVILCQDCHPEEPFHSHMKKLYTPIHNNRDMSRQVEITPAGTISKSQMNKLENFMKQPERYATGTEKAIQKVRDARHSFGLIRHKLSEEKQEEFSEAMKIYESKLKSLR